MEDFEKKLSIADSMETEERPNENCSSSSSSSIKDNKILDLLRRFLDIQERRAQAYAKLKKGFSDYMVSGGELAYQQLCSEITVEFNDCSKQVLEMESLFLNPDYCRADLAQLLRAVQTQEKEKLHLSTGPPTNPDSSRAGPNGRQSSPSRVLTELHSQDLKPRFLVKLEESHVNSSTRSWTAKIQVLKKGGRPSERLVNHENCKFKKPMEHECVHLHEITEAAGTEEAEADAEYDNALNEAIRGVQDAVTTINEHLEEVRYEIEALEAQ